MDRYFTVGDVIETERLVIRREEAADADEILSFINSDFVTKYNCYKPLTREKLIKNIAERPEYVLCRKSDGRVIGTLGVHEDSMRFNPESCELCYLLAEEYARRGYMSEAIRAVAGSLFASGKKIVSARVFSDNAASRRLLESLGFRLDGCLRKAVIRFDGVLFDDCLYSVTEEELT